MAKTETKDTIQEKAMLATLNISRWSASKQDPRVSEQIARDNNAEAMMGRYIKRLLVKEALEQIRATAYRARHYHYDNTLPWSDKGARILPAKNYFDYMKAMKEFQRVFEREVTKFAAQYEEYVADARRRLGGLFNADEYPPADQIAGMFKMKLEVTGMPSAEDFRVNLGAEETAAIRAGIEAQLNESVNSAVMDIWQRIHDHVTHLTEKLGAYEKTADGKVKNPFRDSTIENMKELVALLPRLNVTGSADLDAMTKRLSDEIASVNPAELRESPEKRKAVTKKAEAILEDVAKKTKKKADAILKDVGDLLG